MTRFDKTGSGRDSSFGLDWQIMNFLWGAHPACACWRAIIINFLLAYYLCTVEYFVVEVDGVLTYSNLGQNTQTGSPGRMPLAFNLGRKVFLGRQIVIPYFFSKKVQYIDLFLDLLLEIFAKMVSSSDWLKFLNKFSK